jgi:formylglycine-generating enzyme required for sulfatase activity
MNFPPLKTFIIYARKDESFKDDLLLHLRGTLVATKHLQVWEDGDILPGEDWEKKIEEQLEAADLFLVLLSIHSLTSTFIQKKELLRALERKQRIVPILVRSCLWQTNPVFRGLQGLPKNMKPVASFTDPDDAWTEVMAELHDMVESGWAESKNKAAAEKKRKDEAARPAEQERQKGIPEMLPVKGGTFRMSDTYQVTLSDFEIAKYPVTQKLWQEIMGNNPSHFKGDDLPVENVNWDDCQQFLKKLNEKFPGKTWRLPTEAEWEFAARGGTLSKGYEYAGSNQLDEAGWFWENSGDKALSGEWKSELLTQNKCRTHPVGQKKANELGIHDMSGNVWEWCQDWYGPYPNGPQTNPRGPKTGDYRVNRGGSWLDRAQYCRVSYRNSNTPSYRNFYLGFRPVRQ